jgi:hypothetical protein
MPAPAQIAPLFFKADKVMTIEGTKDGKLRVTAPCIDGKAVPYSGAHPIRSLE